MTEIGSNTQVDDDQSTMDLLVRVREGDDGAAEALLQRCLPPLKRWAHGRLPMQARRSLDTDDIVQAAVFQLLKRIDQFEPRHVGAMQAYLRQSVVNRIRDEVRRLMRRPALTELPEELSAETISPLEQAIRNQEYAQYKVALGRLRPRDRAIVVGRIELQWTLDEIVERFGYHSQAAARMAVTRAVRRLVKAAAEPDLARGL